MKQASLVRQRSLRTFGLWRAQLKENVKVFRVLVTEVCIALHVCLAQIRAYAN